MELATYRDYLRRAEDAESVRELHRIANEVQTLYRNDPDAEAVDRACWMHAERLIARGRHRAGGAQVGAHADWKERAARM
jgi:hypothetical protein